ncbi:MAG: hypothetical protein JXA92_08635 [candidate division Zixibacteria bacterium]|nr:hypothetical protein [candidate division Zixibacteria bacterium]
MTVKAGEIKVSDIIDGKTLNTGSNFTIIWKVSGDVLPYVKIDLLDIEGRLVNKISGGTPSNNVYKWDIPADLAEGDYRIKIYTNDLSSEGTSGIFHIRAVPQGIKAEEIKPPPIEGITQETTPASRKTESRKEKPRIIASEPRPDGKSPDAVHQGRAVMPVVTFDDPKLEEIVRGLIEKKAPVTVFSSDFRKITKFEVRDAGIVKISGMEYFDSLVTLDLGKNNITDLSRLKYLKKLRVLMLDQNWIEDLTPLVENEYIAEGVMVDLSGNPIDCALQADNIARLKKRGVKLLIDCP